MSSDLHSEQFHKGVETIQNSFAQMSASHVEQQRKLRDENSALRTRIAELEKELSVVNQRYSILRSRVSQLSEDGILDTPSSVPVRETTPRKEDTFRFTGSRSHTMADLNSLLNQERTPLTMSGITVTPERAQQPAKADDTVNPQQFYKEVKDVLSREQFARFAHAIRSFNAGELMQSEILDIMRSIGLSGSLYSQFERLLAQTK
ncbi:hypothetical protein RCL1_002640 [Eukaryota sp. TZLM3-RCL]